MKEDFFYTKWLLELTNQEFNGNFQECISVVKTLDVFGLQVYS